MGQPYLAQNQARYKFILKTLNAFLSIFTNAHLTGCSTEAFILFKEHGDWLHPCQSLFHPNKLHNCYWH